MTFWESFWALSLWFLWAFVFIAYLMVLFNIILDIFRDPKLNGWMKALWVVFLVFLPFLTALIYLIARGGGMAERGAREVSHERQAAEDYIRRVAGQSPSDEIEKASRLLSAGTITAEEFERIKARALG